MMDQRTKVAHDCLRWGAEWTAPRHDLPNSYEEAAITMLEQVFALWVGGEVTDSDMRQFMIHAAAFAHKMRSYRSDR